ncbi:hypothetical protein DPMN_023287 [Dreissena polymorpha]|uniref:Uncharacterized protein n=1 Tax=Dreissena polymorpha TaxID=45954 RepID=A0A9D4LM30_DREPO|nr:hypothetical protein DPMN_023287 [Dreissena polymorpha]
MFFFKVNGIWSTWSNYTRCTVTCGGGTRARLRKCEYTPGFQQGDACVGHNNETQQCNINMCPGRLILQVCQQGNKLVCYVKPRQYDNSRV